MKFSILCGDWIEEKKKIMNMGLKLKETFYLSHGAPSLVIDDSIPAWHFFNSWKEQFPTKPSSILVISAHWDTHVPTVNVVHQNDTIYDFYGFPKSMYKVNLPSLNSNICSSMLLCLIIIFIKKK